ncbi:hypothetical protein EHE19_012665 [Ruminiclostridium herbifermentans]|uniref:Uncharacterized protein n=1 Tax=Ruminiclostridium herbifermentans TaxID=2488810 RepID=A0A4U7JI35_9FIRM|nr:hypothetical protein [Ruminiclostridium herbifermentans]QNU65760.1 hypothetical protein EHE19_012665 [Ruminiclostridium herbifermentans]
MLLKKSDLPNTYASVAFEYGMFLIDAKDKTLSLSKNIAVTKYDNIDKSILIRDIKKSKK